MMCAIAKDKASLSVSEDVTAKAKERLKMAPYLPVRNVSCEYDDGVLILRGEVPTFFEKQLAQEAVFKLEGVTQRGKRDQGGWRPRACGDIAAKYRYALQCSDPEERTTMAERSRRGGPYSRHVRLWA